MGANINKQKRAITINQKKPTLSCEQCKKNLLENEIISHICSFPNTPVKHKKTPIPHNTPNLNFTAVNITNLIKEEDLIGFEYSPEIFEHVQSNPKINGISNEIHEYCSENNKHYNDIPFDKKYIALKANLNKIKIDWREGYCELEVSRENILEEVIPKFAELNMFKELKIKFKGEVSQDAGGLIREWFTVLFKALLGNDLGLFVRADSDEFVYNINPEMEITEDNLNYFYFIGKVIAKALLENVTINTCFSHLIYKLILSESIGLHDLLFYEQSLYRSLIALRQNKDRIEDLEIYYCLDMVCHKNSFVTVELIPNGANVKVTKDTLDDYIHRRIVYHVSKCKPFIRQIKYGLLSIIPEHFIFVFNSNELELILNGKPFIDLDDWKSNTVLIEPYDMQHHAIIWFWEVLNNMDQDSLAKLLQFCTGSLRVPITGFRELESNRGTVSRFTINYVQYQSSNQFIKAHTCFNRIDLPEYPTLEELERNILFIINNVTMGFGIE